MLNKLGVVAMTQDDIKKLALRVATEMYIGEDVVVERYNLDQFATRFLAAYLAEQGPVATVQDAGFGLGSLAFLTRALPVGTKLFTTPPLPDTAPTEQGCAECGKKASEGWALYCVKCAEQIKDATLAENVERLAASHAREANLREAITASLDTVGHAENARNILVNALSIPADDTALRERLKEERALCAKVCNDRRRTVSNGNGILFFSHDAASIEAGFCADAILMLT